MCKDMRRMDEKDKCNIILEDDCFYIQIIFSNVKDEIYLDENLVPFFNIYLKIHGTHFFVPRTLMLP